MEDVTLVEIPSMQVIGIRKRGHYSLVSELLPGIFEYAMKNRMQIAGMPMLIMHETSKEEAVEADRTGNADVEVAVPVAGKVSASGEIKVYTLPGGRMARIVHMGPYETCEVSYQKVMDWIAVKGLQVKGPIREAYYNNPHEVKPEEIMTEILVPV